MVTRVPYRSLPVVILTTVFLFVLAGCGGLAPEATPLPTRTPMPTFTPTPEGAAAVVVEPTAIMPVEPPAQEGQMPAQPQEQAPQEQVDQTPATQEQAPTPGAPAETPTPEPTPTVAAAQVVVNGQVNIRQGPGTTYGLQGSASPGETFTVIGKNPAGDWWQIEFNGQPAWVFAQLVTPSNTEAVAVAQNIPPAPTAPPPPPATNTPVPQPAEPAPTQPPARNYEFNIALLQKCAPNAGVTYVEGTVYKNGQPISGNLVAFSYAPDGPVVASIQAGPHQGYPGWRTGFYSHILQTNGAREGTWFFWIVDTGGNRISEIASVHTDGVAGDGKCQQAVIDFDSR